ncbi:hypothetical protein K501DRAFT_285408 [Backusella circina FSU 941]|nr:hypothetical protein K501DRAFT_285408 [Backusella circina FSU 941]
MSSILEKTVEHVVMFGNSDSSSKPKVVNYNIGELPRNLNVSLFERWEVSRGEMIRLKEQWRMHSKVATVVHQFYAPPTTNIDNKIYSKNRRMDVLYGISQRTYYVEYQADRSDPGINDHYSTSPHTEFTNAEVNEARFVTHLAVYMSQQPYPVPQVTILTLTVQQKYIIRRILLEEIPGRTSFLNNISSIAVDSVDQITRHESSFVIISTATPGKSNSYVNNVPFALTRARYGLMVIGKPGVDKVHYLWNYFAEHMKNRRLDGKSLQLTCHTHAVSAPMSYWTDFIQMKNSGCDQPCRFLMSCGHVCPEDLIIPEYSHPNRDLNQVSNT